MAKRKQNQDPSKEEMMISLEQLAKDIYRVRNEFKITRKIEKPHLIKEKKRERARILTRLREMELKAMQSEENHG